MTSILDKNLTQNGNRILIGTPTRGLIRAEWMHARFGQIIPTNWGHVEMSPFMSSHIPVNYQIPDAENVIAKTVVEKNFEWLLFIEDDNILPLDAFIKLNEYMLKGDIPIVGALYFTKGNYNEPMVYRKPGWGYFDRWKLGDKVWVRGLPFGFTLIHGSIIKALWNESPEYLAGNQVTRRIFKLPVTSFRDPDSNDYLMTSGTTDLQFCDDVIKKDIFTKAGWKSYSKRKYPFLVDTSIFVRHIDQDGVMYPQTIPMKFKPNGRPPREIK